MVTPLSANWSVGVGSPSATKTAVGGVATCGTRTVETPAKSIARAREKSCSAAEHGDRRGKATTVVAAGKAAMSVGETAPRRNKSALRSPGQADLSTAAALV